MSDELLSARPCVRSYAVEDISVRSDGDGRTVEAYTAVFNRDAEIRDQDGHYNERLSPGSFTKTIADNQTRFGVFYNHARTIYGTPDGNLSVPIGVPLEPPLQDERGVFTVTRYLDNPLADSTLDGIRQGAIRGYSFGGRFVKSMRARASVRGGLPTITRSEVAMREYGPTVFPAYTDAVVTGTRSVSAFLDELSELGPDDVDKFRQMLGIATPLEPSVPEGTPSGAAQVEEPAPGHSARQNQFNYAAQLRLRGVRSP